MSKPIFPCHENSLDSWVLLIKVILHGTLTSRTENSSKCYLRKLVSDSLVNVNMNISISLVFVENLVSYLFNVFRNSQCFKNSGFTRLVC